MSDMGLTIRANKIAVKVKLHGLILRTILNYTPRTTGEETLGVNGKAEELAVKQERMASRAVIIWCKNFTFKFNPSETSLSSIIRLNKTLLDSKSINDNIEKLFWHYSNIRFAIGTITNFSRGSHITDNSCSNT